MKVLGDVSANHTGATHDWFQKAQADPECDERGFYFWQDDGYLGWLGVKSLPKLNYESQCCGIGSSRTVTASCAGGSPVPTGWTCG
jgi:glycosidase